MRVDGTINDDCITVFRLLLVFVGKRRNEVDDDDVVDAGDIGVNVSDDEEQVEFVGLGQTLGELGGGKRSISGC